MTKVLLIDSDRDEASRIAESLGRNHGHFVRIVHTLDQAATSLREHPDTQLTLAVRTNDATGETLAQQLNENPDVTGEVWVAARDDNVRGKIVGKGKIGVTVRLLEESSLAALSQSVLVATS